MMNKRVTGPASRFTSRDGVGDRRATVRNPCRCHERQLLQDVWDRIRERDQLPLLHWRRSAQREPDLSAAVFITDPVCLSLRSLTRF